MNVHTRTDGASYVGHQCSTTDFFFFLGVGKRPEVTKVSVYAFPYNNELVPRRAPCLTENCRFPYLRDVNEERRHEKAIDQIEKFYEIFRDLSFEISLTDALILLPKFASTLKALIGNKEKLSEMARTPLNEHCSAVILNKLPKKLRDPVKFLIPCDFPRMDECLALADLGASINLMPLSVWKKLSLPELTPTCMTLELADRSISLIDRYHEDVDVKTGRALIDVYEGELTLRVGKEAVTFNLGQTSRYSSNHDDMTARPYQTFMKWLKKGLALPVVENVENELILRLVFVTAPGGMYAMNTVLLFNSRLKMFSGKLKSRWSGPFTIGHGFPYGTVELSQNSGLNFKDCPGFFKASRARGFVLRSLELQILSFIWEIQYPNLIDQRLSLSILNKRLRIY
ncbi:reverse transcriptase domain-containing protein, partial [Tanacetum coccineum]